MVTLGSKFLLMIFLTKFLSPEEVGIYGVISTSIGLSIYLVGLDFYTFNTREILANDSVKSVLLIRDQFVFHFLSYFIFFPILMMLFAMNIIPISYIALFYILLVLEHLSQELNRIFVALSKPIVANITLFFRSGAWAYVAIALLYFSEDSRELWTVLIGWIIGVLISIILSIYFLKDLDWKITIGVKVNWKWIKRGLIVAFPLFLGNIAIKITEYLDRYFLTFYKGNALVGAYTFYGSIANLLVIFTQTGILMILGPKIISSYQKGHIKEYKSYMRKMSGGVVISTVVILLFLAFAIFPITNIIDKPIYIENINAYWILLLGFAFSVFSLIPHQALYVRHKDKEIIIASLLSLVVSVISNIVLVERYGIVGAATSTLVAFITQFLFKCLFVYRIKKEKIRL